MISSNQNSTEKKGDSDSDYCVERIVGYIRYDEAYKELFAHGNTSYSRIFENDEGKRHTTVCKYYFLIKWADFGGEEMTWEPESNCLSIEFLDAYKKINGLPLSLNKLAGTVNFDKYEELRMKERVATVPKNFQSVDVTKYEYNMFDESYNSLYGRIKRSNLVLTEKLEDSPKQIVQKGKFGDDQECLLIEKMVYVPPSVIVEANKREVLDYILSIDRSYMGEIILHNNVVKILDIYWDATDAETLYKVSYISEYCDEKLSDHINEGMKTQMVTDLAHDMLCVFSMIHSYGIHGRLSIESIMFKKGHYKISDLENFVFETRINDFSVLRREDSVYALKKYGIQRPFDFTVDMYSLGLVVLQCLTSVLTYKKTYAELQKDIDDKMKEITQVAKHFINLLLRAREYIYRYNLPAYRFTSGRLVVHPFMSQDSDENEKLMNVCFLYSYSAFPIEEVVQYTENSTVDEVLVQLADLYFSEQTPKEEKKLQMIAVDRSATAPSNIKLVEASAKFSSFAHNESENQDLIVTRVIRLIPANRKKFSTFIVQIPSVLGSCPIIIEGNPLTIDNIEKIVADNVFGGNMREQFSISVSTFQNNNHIESSPPAKKAKIEEMYDGLSIEKASSNNNSTNSTRIAHYIFTLLDGGHSNSSNTDAIQNRFEWYQNEKKKASDYGERDILFTLKD